MRKESGKQYVPLISSTGCGCLESLLSKDGLERILYKSL